MGFKVGEESNPPSADKWNFINYGEVEAEPSILILTGHPTNQIEF